VIFFSSTRFKTGRRPLQLNTLWGESSARPAYIGRHRLYRFEVERWLGVRTPETPHHLPTSPPIQGRLLYTSLSTDDAYSNRSLIYNADPNSPKSPPTPPTPSHLITFHASPPSTPHHLPHLTTFHTSPPSTPHHLSDATSLMEERVTRPLDLERGTLAWIAKWTE
jgi:hypothetical protein